MIERLAESLASPPCVALRPNQSRASGPRIAYEMLRAQAFSKDFERENFQLALKRLILAEKREDRSYKSGLLTFHRSRPNPTERLGQSLAD